MYFSHERLYLSPEAVWGSVVHDLTSSDQLFGGGHLVCWPESDLGPRQDIDEAIIRECEIRDKGGGGGSELRLCPGRVLAAVAWLWCLGGVLTRANFPQTTDTESGVHCVQT